MGDRAEEESTISPEASSWHNRVFGNDLWLYCESLIFKGTETTSFLILQWVGSTLPQYCVPSAYAGGLSLTTTLLRCPKACCGLYLLSMKCWSHFFHNIETTLWSKCHIPISKIRKRKLQRPKGSHWLVGWQQVQLDSMGTTSLRCPCSAPGVELLCRFHGTFYFVHTRTHFSQTSPEEHFVTPSCHSISRNLSDSETKCFVQGHTVTMWLVVTWHPTPCLMSKLAKRVSIPLQP